MKKKKELYIKYSRLLTLLDHYEEVGDATRCVWLNSSDRNRKEEKEVYYWR